MRTRGLPLAPLRILKRKLSLRSSQASSSGGTLVRLTGVTKIYASEAGGVPALRAVDADFGRGEFVVIYGKSGAGKSTLVNMLTGVDRLTSGEVWVGGVSIHTLREDALTRWRGENVGVIYQSFELLSQLSNLDNVMLAMDFCRTYGPLARRKRAMDLLKQVGIAEHAHKRPTEISGGQQQRVAIARALANDPALIVADEPTGSLDLTTSDVILQLFEELRTQGKTVVIVSHDRSIAQRATHGLHLADGEIVDEWRRPDGRR